MRQYGLVERRDRQLFEGGIGPLVMRQLSLFVSLRTSVTHNLSGTIFRPSRS